VHPRSRRHDGSLLGELGHHGVADGAFVLTAVAKDAAANSTTSAAVNVTVGETSCPVTLGAAADHHLHAALFGLSHGRGRCAAGLDEPDE